MFSNFFFFFILFETIFRWVFFTTEKSYNACFFFFMFECTHCWNSTSPPRLYARRTLCFSLPFNSKRPQHQHRCLGHDTHDRCRSGVSDFHMFRFVLSPRGCVQKEPLFLLQVSVEEERSEKT